MLSTTVIFWLTFAILGQSCLLAVLLTLAFVKSLPQRNNPFFINLLLTTFLAQFPPLLLFITGQLKDEPPKPLCLTQSVLMDGVAPMFGLALVVLVFQTWAELRSLALGATPVTVRFPSIRAILILAPYLSMVSWCIASLVAATQVPTNLALTQIVYCGNDTEPGARVRRFVGIFMLIFGIIEFVMEACIVRVIYIHFLSDTRKFRESSVGSYSFVIRIFILCFLQLVPIILATLNSLFKLNSPYLWTGTHILESMNALVTFLVFGTSNELLQTWRLKRRQTRRAIARPDKERPVETIEHISFIDVA